MRLILALTTLLAAFGCTTAMPSGGADGSSARPLSDLVDEDAAAILSGMDQARANEARAGL